MVKIVKKSSLLAMIFSLIISFLLPILVVLYMYINYNMSLKPVLIGVLIFFISQVLLRIPLLRYIKSAVWFERISENILIYSLFLALTAGLFEEVGRYLGMTYLLNSLTLKDGIAIGLGHGGIESILFVGITQINNIIYSLKINQGRFDKEIGSQLPEDTAGEIKNKLIETGPTNFVLGGIERVFSLIIQIGLSVLVLYGIISGKIIFLIYAILLHMLLDTPAAYVKSKEINPWVMQLFLLIVSGTVLYFIIRIF